LARFVGRNEEAVVIPDFDQDGYLPPGVHPATIDEIAERFGWQSEPRQVQMESLDWLLEAARQARISGL
jgi:hypothetical protein